MQWVVIAAVVLFLLFTCQDNNRSANAAAQKARIEQEAAQRFEQEVARRVEIEVKEKVAEKEEALELKYGARRAELKTIRAVGFILLAGGALGGLIWLQRNHAYSPPQPGERSLQMPSWRDHWGLRSTRVLDLPPHQTHPSMTSPASPAPQGAWNQTNNTPPRRRARRRRHRINRTHRNQDYDATPRDS